LPERLSIIFAASEVEGFSKSGGLADVARALPLHLKSMGHDVRIVTPLYRLIPKIIKLKRSFLRLVYRWEAKKVGVQYVNLKWKVL